MVLSVSRDDCECCLRALASPVLCQTYGAKLQILRQTTLVFLPRIPGALVPGLGIAQRRVGDGIDGTVN